jgi:VanZ family protein
MKNNQTYKFFSWLLLFGWAGFIFYSSIIYRPPKILGIFFLDKIIHFFQYGLLAYLFFKAINTTFEFTLRRISFLVITIGFLYGVIIECLQYPLPYRSFSFLDIGANLLGLITVTSYRAIKMS